MSEPIYLSNKGCPRKYIGGQRCQFCRCAEGRCWYEDSVARQKRGEPILDGDEYAAKPGERTEFDATREALEVSRRKRTADRARRESVAGACDYCCPSCGGDQWIEGYGGCPGRGAKAKAAADEARRRGGE